MSPPRAVESGGRERTCQLAPLDRHVCRAAIEENMASQPEAIAVALAEGTAEQREAACAAIEGAIATATEGAAAARGASEQAVALVVACVPPLISGVLCAPASRIAVEEWIRASLLLYAMCKVDLVAVNAEIYRRSESDIPLFFTIWEAEGTVLAQMLAKKEWGRDDAILAAANLSACSVPMWAVGGTAVLAAQDAWQDGPRRMGEMEWMSAWMNGCPYYAYPRTARGGPDDRFAPLALLVLDLWRAESMDELPEGVIAGAGQCQCWMAMGNERVARALFEAGFLAVFRAAMDRFTPLQRISRENMVGCGLFIAFKEVTEQAQAAGIEVVQPLLDAGAVDIVVSTLTAFQMLGPADTSVTAVIWGMLFTLEVLLGSPQAKLIVARLRSAGVDSFRYLLDVNPRAIFLTVSESFEISKYNLFFFFLRDCL